MRGIGPFLTGYRNSLLTLQMTDRGISNTHYWGVWWPNWAAIRTCRTLQGTNNWQGSYTGLRLVHIEARFQLAQIAHGLMWWTSRHCRHGNGELTIVAWQRGNENKLEGKGKRMSDYIVNNRVTGKTIEFPNGAYPANQRTEYAKLSLHTDFCSVFEGQPWWRMSPSTSMSIWRANCEACSKEWGLELRSSLNWSIYSSTSGSFPLVIRSSSLDIILLQ